MWFRLTKHQGLGNDFLVLLTDDVDLAADRAAWSERARRWCSRPLGIGADGLLIGLHGRPDPEVDLVMTLVNGDGSFAEMSGNGIRCLAQAEAVRRDSPEVLLTIDTDGGRRSVRVRPDPHGHRHTVVASVDMGPVRPGPEPQGELQVTEELLGRFGGAVGLGLDATETGTFDVGNPHLVLLVPDAGLVDVGPAGALHQDRYPHGINVHHVSPTPGETDAITLHPWERGVGITDACGTGATVAAHAANRWGLVGERVTVHMPGGDAVVEVGPTMTLHGPSTFVANVDLPR
jgi:diaminopimelate epimerase